MVRRASIDWPPRDWDECDLYRDKETRLPTQLHPFALDLDLDTGLRDLVFRAGRKEKVLATGFSDPFLAFRAMLDAYEAWFPTRPLSRVYFIGAHLKRGELVKVGVSRFPEQRLAQLQTASGEALSIFATTPGDETLEARYHHRWHARRRAGEWFTIGDCIINEIERLRAAA